MNRYILFMILLFSNLSICVSQNDKEEIIGKWKVISVNSGDFYINVKTDSIYISDHFKTVYSDSLKKNDVIKAAKQTFGNSIRVFNEDGGYTMRFGTGMKWNGTYQISPSERKITVNLRDSGGWEMEYKFVENLLHLTTELNKGKSVLILEKI